MTLEVDEHFTVDWWLTTSLFFGLISVFVR